MADLCQNPPVLVAHQNHRYLTSSYALFTFIHRDFNVPILLIPYFLKLCLARVLDASLPPFSIFPPVVGIHPGQQLGVHRIERRAIVSCLNPRPSPSLFPSPVLAFLR